ncbi:hypothetical protein K474DRAFT_1610134, partial [Panus rudis PR-1116 ss-1]
MAARIQQVLNENGPYWVGHTWQSAEEVEGSFVVYEIEPGSSGRRFCITSGDLDEDIILLESQLAESDFDLPRWLCRRLRGDTHKRHHRRACCRRRKRAPIGDAVAEGLAYVLNQAAPMPVGYDGPSIERFICYREGNNEVIISDTYLSFLATVHESVLRNPRFDVVNAYALAACRARLADRYRPFGFEDLEGELLIWMPSNEYMACAGDMLAGSFSLELNAARVPVSDAPEPIAAMQRNAAMPKDLKRLLPEPVVVIVNINGHPARALLDSGSLADFMSSKLAHQLGVRSFKLTKPLPVQLAVQGSQAKINLGCKAGISYQTVNEEQYFDIINLLNYDLILGTPFLFQHQVTLGMNPTTVVVGSPRALPIEGKQVRVLESRAAELYEDKLETARRLLREYAEPICRDASDTPLPPLRAVNHTIPLKDPSKVYSWRPSKCPDALRPLWTEKHDAYLKSGRWRMTSAWNTSPMLLLRKPGTG